MIQSVFTLNPGRHRVQCQRVQDPSGRVGEQVMAGINQVAAAKESSEMAKRMSNEVLNR